MANVPLPAAFNTNSPLPPNAEFHMECCATVEMSTVGSDARNAPRCSMSPSPSSSIRTMSPICPGASSTSQSSRRAVIDWKYKDSPASSDRATRPPAATARAPEHAPGHAGGQLHALGHGHEVIPP